MSESEPVYFSLDVESSGLTPGTGRLLTVGIAAISHDYQIIGTYYGRINRTSQLLDVGWWEDRKRTSMPTDPTRYISDTHVWWSQQSAEAQGEAYGFAEDHRERKLPSTIAAEVVEFAQSFGKEWKDRILVADPVAFDSMWLVSLFDDANARSRRMLEDTFFEPPFHYHSLDIHSMRLGCGLTFDDGAFNLHEGRTLLKHHALDDAISQALEFIAVSTHIESVASRRQRAKDDFAKFLDGAPMTDGGAS